MDRSPPKPGAPPRPLLPAPVGARPEAGASRRPARVNACEACRSHKSKCDGARPSCKACTLRDTECRYGRTEARQIRQRYQQLKERRTAQEGLFDMLQTMNEHDAADVFRRIREGGNAEAIVQHVQEGSLIMELALAPETRTRYEFPYIGTLPATLRDNIYFQSQVYEAIQASAPIVGGSLVRSPTLESNYTKPLQAAAIMDQLLVDARPSQWTRVSSNDSLMRKLIEGYIKYEYPWGFVFHKDYFLEDMASGSNRFCSPLLVNALLAKACACSRILPNSTRFWDPDTLTYRFLAEAKRLSELEDGSPRLTTIQAHCLINGALDVIGHDKLGLKYALKALSMANELGVFKAHHTDDKKFDGVFDKKYEDAKAFTAWGLTTWLTLQSYYYFKPPFMSDPPSQTLPDVQTNAKWYSEVLLRYPLDQKLYSIGFGQNMKAQCELRVIMHDICAMSFRHNLPPIKMPWNQAMLFKDRLLAWFETLPFGLSPKLLLYPSHMKLHCEYYGVLILLFETQLSSLDGNGEVLNEDQRKLAHDVIAQATCHLESLIRLYYLRHSFEAYDALLMIFLAHLANVMLTRLARLEEDPSQMQVSRETIEALRSTLILCLKGLHDQSKNFYISGVVLGVMKNRLSATNRDLVGRYMSLRDPAEDDPEANDQNQRIISEYVIPMVNLNEDPEGARLANMVQEFGGLSHGG